MLDPVILHKLQTEKKEEKLIMSERTKLKFYFSKFKSFKSSLLKNI